MYNDDFSKNNVYETSPNAYGTYRVNEIKCPGKEIAGMVLGIFSLFYGVFAVFFFWYVILSVVFALFAAGTGIAAMVLNNKVKEQATVMTKKTTIGKNLGIAGMICGIVAVILSIIFFIVAITIFGSSFLEIMGNL